MQFLCLSDQQILSHLQYVFAISTASTVCLAYLFVALRVHSRMWKQKWQIFVEAKAGSNKTKRALLPLPLRPFSGAERQKLECGTIFCKIPVYDKK